MFVLLWIEIYSQTNINTNANIFKISKQEHVVSKELCELVRGDDMPGLIGNAASSDLCADCGITPFET